MSGLREPLARFSGDVLYFSFVPSSAALSISSRAISRAEGVPGGSANPLAFADDFDPLAPQREAALFFGLFLRGHSAEALRRDIDVPKKLLDKLMRRHRNELAVREKLRRVYHYRKRVLAVFDELVTRDRTRERSQERIQ